MLLPVTQEGVTARIRGRKNNYATQLGLGLMKNVTNSLDQAPRRVLQIYF